MERDRKRFMVVVVVVALGLLWPGAAGRAGASPGALDQGFGTAGVVQTDLSGLDIGLDVLVQPDGKAISIGFTDGEGVLLRHQVNGTLDPAFGTGGVVRVAAPTFLQAGALQPDGKILVVGSGGPLDNVVVFRFLPSGALDGTFGAGGGAVADFGSVDEAYGVVLQPDGKIVIAGRSGDAVALARFLPGGGLDPAFGTGGKTTSTFGPAGGSAEADTLGILSTGAVVVGGMVNNGMGGVSMLLARYTAGGILDGTFGAGGQVAAVNHRLNAVSSLVVQSGDRIVVAGELGSFGTQMQAIARYLPNGALDLSFGTAGSTQASFGVTSSLLDLAVDGTGRLVASGDVFAGADPESGGFPLLSVSRFSADGTVDATFGCSGTTQIELAAEAGGRGTSVAVAPDGRILVGGTAFTDPATDFGRPDIVLARVLAAGPSGDGYWITRADGGLTPFGPAGGCGSLRGVPLNDPIVGHAGRLSNDGYWFVASDGGIFAFGDAPFLGSAGGMPLFRPVVGMARTPTGNGYWLVASDGGIFNYGDAGFFGSTGGVALNEPVVGMAPTPSGNGYWLVASDGGIFAFGDAAFFGSTGGIPLNDPVVGMSATPSGDGYWLVAADGGIFAFGNAPFLGSTGSVALNEPVVGMSATPSGDGYWLAAADGGVFAFGDASFPGSTGGQTFSSPAVSITPVSPGAG